MEHVYAIILVIYQNYRYSQLRRSLSHLYLLSLHIQALLHLCPQRFSGITLSHMDKIIASGCGNTILSHQQYPTNKFKTIYYHCQYIRWHFSAHTLQKISSKSSTLSTTNLSSQQKFLSITVIHYNTPMEENIQGHHMANCCAYLMHIQPHKSM